MGRDFRLQYLKRYESGIADIRISRSQFRSNIIVSLRDTKTDIYMDGVDSVEEFRACKQGIVVKKPDMFYVQEQYDILSMEDDILPFVVIFTVSGLPRNPHMNDWIIVDGKIFVISKVKPTNRDLGAVLECLVYPMRDSRKLDDPLALYKIRFRRGLVEIPWEEVYSGPVVMDLLYGGCPHWMGWYGDDWSEFYFQSRVKVPGDAVRLYLMDESNQVVSLGFGEEWSVDSSVSNDSNILTL